MPFFKRTKTEKKVIEYKEVTQSELLFSKRSFGAVVVGGTVRERPKILTLKGVFSGAMHEHATIFVLDKGVKVYYPGIALVFENEEVKVYGRFSPPDTVIASKIETNNMSFELQTE